MSNLLEIRGQPPTVILVVVTDFTGMLVLFAKKRAGWCKQRCKDSHVKAPLRLKISSPGPTFRKQECGVKTWGHQSTFPLKFSSLKNKSIYSGIFNEGEASGDISSVLTWLLHFIFCKKTHKEMCFCSPCYMCGKRIFKIIWAQIRDDND